MAHIQPASRRYLPALRCYTRSRTRSLSRASEILSQAREILSSSSSGKEASLTTLLRYTAAPPLTQLSRRRYLTTPRSSARFRALSHPEATKILLFPRCCVILGPCELGPSRCYLGAVWSWDLPIRSYLPPTRSSIRPTVTRYIQPTVILFFTIRKRVFLTISSTLPLDNEMFSDHSPATSLFLASLSAQNKTSLTPNRSTTGDRSTIHHSISPPLQKLATPQNSITPQNVLSLPTHSFMFPSKQLERSFLHPSSSTDHHQTAVRPPSNDQLFHQSLLHHSIINQVVWASTSRNPRRITRPQGLGGSFTPGQKAVPDEGILRQ